MIIELEVPDDFKIPEGCKAVWMSPKKDTRFLSDDNIECRASHNWNSYRICFIPKHAWPSWLKCAAISRNNLGYVAHIEKPFINGNGEWCSVVPWCINPSMFADPIPALEVGECFFNPNFKE